MKTIIRFLAFCLLFISFNAFGQNVKYVDSSVVTSGNGNSWATAIKSLSVALDSAHKNIFIDSILVAEGTYSPEKKPYNMSVSKIGSTIVSFNTNDQTFHIRSGLEVYGGYPSGGGARDHLSNITILSGAIPSAFNSDTAYHVVLMDSSSYWGQSNDTSVVNGFTITNGRGIYIDSILVNSTEIRREVGNAIHISNGTNLISNCLITSNRCDGSYKANPGVYIKEGMTTISHCSFTNNVAIAQHSTMRSIPVNTAVAGVYTDFSGGYFATVDIDNTTFSNNVSSSISTANSSFSNYITTHAIGAVHHARSLTNCDFVSNSAKDEAFGSVESMTAVGAVYQAENITNCNFISNRAEVQSPSDFQVNKHFVTVGAIYNRSNENKVTNCVFAQNKGIGKARVARCYAAGSIYSENYVGFYTPPSYVKSTNCTFYKDSAWAETSSGGAHAAGSFFMRQDSLLLNNGIIWGTYGTTIGSSPPAAAISGDTTINHLSGKIGVNHSLLSGYTGNCNSCLLRVSPTFEDTNSIEGVDGILGTADDGLRLEKGSLGVDAGNNSYLSTGITQDATGSQRISGSSIDMGAYELDACITVPSTVYVDVNATGGNNGENWADAYTDLQDALDVNMSCGNVDTIKVATGTYSPTAAPNDTITDLRDFTFHMADSSVVLIGGYNSSTGLKTTTRSVLQGVNNYHVFMTSDLPVSTELNNFQVSRGRGNRTSAMALPYDGKYFSRDGGGGMINAYSDIKYIDCIFTDNESPFGGAIRSEYGSDSFYNCVITKNIAVTRSLLGSQSQGIGGGVYSISGDIYLEDCLLDSNQANTVGVQHSNGTWSLLVSSGGGISVNNGTLTANNSVFVDNTAVTGVGLVSNSSTSTLTNCVFSNNITEGIGNGAINKPQSGAGIWSSQSNNKIIGCTFVGNEAVSDAAIYSGYKDSIEIRNSVFYDNKNDNIRAGDIGQDTTVYGSILQNSSHNASDVGDTSVLDTGGGFVDLSAAYYKDLFMDSTNFIGADDIWGTDDDGLNLSVSSLLIGKGTALNGITEDIVGTARNASPCIGAYELDICSETSGTVYVDVNATGVNSGLSWANAFTDLQDALDLRMSCNNVDTILIAEGTYYPTSAPDETTTDPRKRAFHLASANVVVIGGYDPVSGTKTGDTTFLDGDLVTSGTATDSALHVLCFTQLGSSTTFENLSIVNGKANSWTVLFYGGRTFANHSGGGIIIINANVHLKNVLLDNNYAVSGGGAIYVYNGYPRMDYSVVSNNEAYSGGAIYTVSNVGFSISNTVFHKNKATNGGAMFGTVLTSGEISNTLFIENEASANGGAVYVNSTSSPVYNHVSFVGNTANNGGAAYIDNSSTPTFKNSVLYDNTGTSNPEMTLLNSSSINSSSTNNASSLGSSSSLSSIGTGFVSLNGLYYKEVFKDSTDLVGADKIWGTSDDGLIPIDTAAINSNVIPGTEKDIAEFYRGSSSSIGAYETRACLPSNVLPTELDSIYSSSIKTTDSNNWSHYCSDNGEILLSLDLTNGNAVVNADEVRLKTGPSRAFSTTSYGNSFSNTLGYAMVDKRWDVSPTTNNSTGTVGVRYYFTSEDYNDIKVALAAKSTTVDSAQQLQMYKATNGAAFSDPHLVNTRVISKGTVADTTNWIYSTHNTTNHRAEFTVKSFSGGGGGAFGGGGGPVPVELLYFEVSKENNDGLLSWTTASEIDNSHFEIQRSSDGISFTPIARVEGNGNSQEIINYTYLDNDVLEYHQTVYYRLKQYDFDGAFEYSPIRFLKNEEEQALRISVYPNPTQNTLYVQLRNANSFNESMITLVTSQGLPVLETSTDGNFIEMDMSVLSKGIYWLSVTNGGETQQIKVVKI